MVIQKKFLAVLLTCLLPVATPFARGQATATDIIDQFNAAGTGGYSYAGGQITRVWNNWFGGAFQSLTWDSSNDANHDPNSGSMKIAANFPVDTDQFEVWDGIDGINPAVNGIIFTNFSCDVRFAAGSATNLAGNYGSLQFGLPTAGYGQDYFNGGIVIGAGYTNWVHVSIPLNANTDSNLLNVSGVLIHIWGAGLAGPITLWVDNVEFTGMATNSGTATIDYTNTQQRIDGFGASSAWMTGALSGSDADLLFSTNLGAGLSLLRTRIAPDKTTWSWEESIAQQAQARGARIWSTPWTPPAGFKDTNSVDGGDFVSSPANYQGYAAWLASYVVFMKTNGINLYAVSVQNEPTENVDYESCVWTAQQIHDFVPELAAALTASNAASTQIILPENYGWSWDLATNTMNDLTTSNLVGILAGHNYGSAATPVTQFGAVCPKTLWETEHYFGSGDDITNGLELAQEIHSFLTVARVNAYHYWWLEGSGNGSIADNPANPAKRLYVMGNYSRFIRPNFYRVAVTNGAVALVSAYKDTNSDTFVIVAANPNPITVNQNIRLNDFPTTSTLTLWVTSASLSLSNQGPVGVTNGVLNYVIPPLSIVTLVGSPTNYAANLEWTLSGRNLTLNWPSAYLGWFLQSQTNRLGGGLGTNWADVMGSPATNQVTFRIDPANGSVFYRLVKQH